MISRDERLFEKNKFQGVNFYEPSGRHSISNESCQVSEHVCQTALAIGIIITKHNRPEHD